MTNLKHIPPSAVGIIYVLVFALMLASRTAIAWCAWSVLSWGGLPVGVPTWQACGALAVVLTALLELHAIGRMVVKGPQ